MDDPELDYWPLSVWADPEHELHDRLAEELEDATSMDDDERVACFAFLQAFASRLPDGQYIAEQIEALFEDHLVATYTSWGHFAELWADACRSEGAVNGMLSAARDLGHQDVFFEILEQWGQHIAAGRDHEHLWFFHVATLLDGRVFCLERPKP
jgi:hypothetical protein